MGSIRISFLCGTNWLNLRLLIILYSEYLRIGTTQLRMQKWETSPVRIDAYIPKNLDQIVTVRCGISIQIQSPDKCSNKENWSNSSCNKYQTYIAYAHAKEVSIHTIG